MRKVKVVTISGGTGSAKLLRGMASVLARFTVVCNVADNITLHGLYICPDVDTVLYSLAGIADQGRGWGVAGDTFKALAAMDRLGAEKTWFKLGDADLATHILRTSLLARGWNLTEITQLFARRLGIKHRILPVTDSHVETHISTRKEEMHLQEFWVREHGRPKAISVTYHGATRARASGEVLQAISSADRIVFCPGNPVTSILPILSIPGVKDAMRRSAARKLAVSPMIGTSAVSGPATALMRSQGYQPTSLGVAALYRGLVDVFVIDESDRSQASEIERTGMMECVCAPTLMKTAEDEVNLARLALGA